ncbi:MULTISPECIES: alcohol dehydrogenase catalytic domain-containing protein [Ralstonia solanacearum species complex]|uniref:Alcohol dehydrogenase-like N-terminal domain-containing protein n=1 Tax=Ralstonia solanacearum K60 TaxID=1091042 RepID=A0AAP8D2R9_RALSL|nr:alcohol dehydrogenase catalytic domain-containing protein [Ralstonia solanacearum]OYQ11947.1 hypothetical protein B7R77_00810 [Ralstonia solanacearum K60]CCF96067.1 hypothetical protein RSK60_1300008 [Ralstonia solanacearum K60]
MPGVHARRWIGNWPLNREPNDHASHHALRPRDIRFEDRPDPQILKPSDAIVRIAAACVCGSDLWPYRGIQAITEPMPVGHEYCGVVEEVGSEVRHIKLGQFVIGAFFASDNACPVCQHGYQSSCQQAEFVGGAQAPLLRVPLADGTLVATPGIPSKGWVSFTSALTRSRRASSKTRCRYLMLRDLTYR